ncbi:uracil-DNA glycosylase family protein [Kibdelosporangium philippinense]|uniref:Uracil-DNA glycosylase family protein n=1 Tax=Kibdelosporangium philippinense TaxID=211113 RepID=A0ABS8ZF07_9PSEU|nr:uracil-DNA glycosylase family protein [Kibdelosporangium philippinense]MCE7004422.1 uracil-DNA glycosylase family protein [Kibdelosporangium philippinense]
MTSRLARIRDEIIAANAGRQPVYQAEAAARIVIIGQAPGKRAQDSGVPFDDPSGVRLRDWLGVTDEQFYDPSLFAILPMDFYYPGKAASGDLPPRADFAPQWHPQILAELNDVRLTLLIGGYSQKLYLKGRLKPSLTETVRSYQDYLPEIIPLVHPSPLNFRWQGKNPWFVSEVLPVLRDAVQRALS